MQIDAHALAGKPVNAYAFVDETKPNDGRYGAVCIVCVRADTAAEIAAELKSALGEVREFKFGRTDDGRMKRAASRMLAVALKHIENGQIEIGTLSWDREDSRNRVEGRDDYENMARMLYHLLVNTVLKWRDAAVWELRHDR